MSKKIYMFSEKYEICCSIESDGRYYVHNGNWYGTRDGDLFTIEKTGMVLTITDWEEKTVNEVDEEFRKYIKLGGIKQ